MKKSQMFRWMVFILSIQLISPVTYSQVIEVTGGIGYTAVNIDQWYGTEKYGATLLDWSHFSGYVTAQGFYALNKTLSIGIGAGYQYLFWYDIKTYSGSYYEYEVDAFRLTALARLNFKNNFIDFGFGTFLFEDSNDFASVVSFGHSFRLTDKLALPVKVNCNAIFDKSSIVAPVTLGIGLSYKIK
ncbi:MAG: hypothetical protein ABR974_08855 [Bacteroidales bacterium]